MVYGGRGGNVAHTQRQSPMLKIRLREIAPAAKMRYHATYRINLFNVHCTRTGLLSMIREAEDQLLFFEKCGSAVFSLEK